MLAETEIRDEERQAEVVAEFTSFPQGDLGVGAALWEATDGEWKMIKCISIEGYEPGDPPTERALYEGQIVQKLCQPVRG